MAYVVSAQNGDCLCSIARRHGYSNCGTVRSHSANALLVEPLQAGDQVTIPQARDGWIYTKIATGRRWTVRWLFPVAAPQPKQVRFVRTGAAAMSAADAIGTVGISRFHPTLTTGDDLGPAWVDHTHRVYDQDAFGDPNCFNVEVIDPDRAAQDVVVWLEALQPLYDHDLAGVPTRQHQRFAAAGGVRAARSLAVTVSPSNGPNGIRHRSCYLRLVAHPTDKAARPQQTLLVTDLVDEGNAQVEILDQDVVARYEDPDCPRLPGERCLYATAQLSLPRGEEVGVEARILRNVRSGVVGQLGGGPGDDGVVQLDDLRRRILRNNRRIWAQEELIRIRPAGDRRPAVEHAHHRQ